MRKQAGTRLDVRRDFLSVGTIAFALFLAGLLGIASPRLNASTKVPNTNQIEASSPGQAVHARPL